MILYYPLLETLPLQLLLVYPVLCNDHLVMASASEQTLVPILTTGLPEYQIVRCRANYFASQRQGSAFDDPDAPRR